LGKCKQGDVYGRLTLMKKGEKNKYGVDQWWCQCNCGNPAWCLVAESQLIPGKTKSCGCLATENKRKIGKNNIKITFEDWCNSNNKSDFLDLWDDELNDESPDAIGYSSSKDCYFLCQNDSNHHPTFKLRNITKDGQYHNIDCYICNSFGYNLILKYGQDALNKYWDYDKNNGIDPLLIAKNTNKKLYIYCQNNQKHGSYPVTGTHFWQRGQRCPYCAKRKVFKEESLGYLHPEVLDLWSDKNQKSPYEFSESSGRRVFWKCNEGVHDDYSRTIKDSKKTYFVCPECRKLDTESNLEKSVKSFIQNNYSYTINTEYDCSIVPINPKTNHKLPYDNEVKELKLIIEVHGEQHYQVCQFTTLAAQKYNISPEEQLEYQQWKDNFKKEYALKNGYSYLEIPYWTIKNNTYKEIIDNKIKELCYKNA
jgi:hypothetical protein